MIRSRIGFLQGRMSPPVDGRIQAFPWQSWREEFQRAETSGFELMEWTIDEDRLYENPLLTGEGQALIRQLSRSHRVRVASLTGDCFMQAPFWKALAQDVERLRSDFRAVIGASAEVGITMVVVPLVDNGRLETREQEDLLVEALHCEQKLLESLGVRVVFESDFAPKELRRFIERFDPHWFGINYDIGNSAALGFDAAEELASYGSRVFNVHVKDRMLGGTTVPLGTGAARFESVFAALKRAGYTGNFVLQTARAADGDHVGAVCRYRDMTIDWWFRA